MNKSFIFPAYTKGGFNPVGYLEKIDKSKCSITTDKEKALKVDRVDVLRDVINLTRNLPVFNFGIEVYANDK